MYSETDQNTNHSEAAEDTSPAASISDIINRENSMSKIWPFVGGVVVGAEGIVTAALVVDKMTYGEVEVKEQGEQTEPLALPEGDAE